MLNNILLYGYITLDLAIRLLMATWGHFYLLAIVHNSTMNIHI